MLLNVLVIVPLLTLRCSAVFHPFFEFHDREASHATFGGALRMDGRAPIPLPAVHSTVIPGFATLPLDHFGTHNGTFQNRYWVLDEFYEPGGPVFLYDAGEGDAEPGVQGRLLNDGSFFRQLVRDFGGIGVVWEHRYYGASAHVAISLETPIEEFQWLTTAQALADVPAFASNFSVATLPDADLTPTSTPWIFVGGSYPGMRAAFARQKYPDTIFASFSSSAPVQAQVNMSVYFDVIYRGLTSLGFANCTNDIAAAVRYIDSQLANATAAAAIKRLYLGVGADANSNEGFADVLTYIYYGWQSSEVNGDQANLRSFCDWMSTDPATGQLADGDGWAKSRGAKYASDRWAAWPKLADVVNYYTPTNCAGHYGNSSKSTPECRLDDAFPSPSSISWTYQYCSEWGFFQSANTGPHAIVSSYNSLSHQQDICYRQFPNGVSSGFLPSTPSVDRMNLEYGGWDLRPSNVFFSGGEFDPWRTLSLLSDEPWAPRDVQLTQEIPEQGVAPSHGKVFGYLLKGAAHCYDFRTNWVDGAASRGLFADALRKWLPGYQKAEPIS